MIDVTEKPRILLLPPTVGSLARFQTMAETLCPYACSPQSHGTGCAPSQSFPKRLLIYIHADAHQKTPQPPSAEARVGKDARHLPASDPHIIRPLEMKR